MSEQASSGWIATIILIIIIPLVLNYFTELTTPFIRLYLARVAIWPSKRRLRALEEALNQARSFRQDTRAFYRYLLTEAFLILCFLSLCIFMVIMMYSESSPLPDNPKDLTLLKDLLRFAQHLAFSAIGVVAMLLALRAASALVLLYSVDKFIEFEPPILAEIAMLKEKIARRDSHST
jgi:hypothetical protein